MVDEHFGICVVEYMAAGAVPVAHASAGPAMDIVVPAFKIADASMDDDDGCAVGFLASTEAEYAACMPARCAWTRRRATRRRGARARAAHRRKTLRRRAVRRPRRRFSGNGRARQTAEGPAGRRRAGTNRADPEPAEGKGQGKCVRGEESQRSQSRLGARDRVAAESEAPRGDGRRQIAAQAETAVVRSPRSLCARS